MRFGFGPAITWWSKQRETVNHETNWNHERKLTWSRRVLSDAEKNNFSGLHLLGSVGTGKVGYCAACCNKATIFPARVHTRTHVVTMCPGPPQCALRDKTRLWLCVICRCVYVELLHLKGCHNNTNGYADADVSGVCETYLFYSFESASSRCIVCVFTVRACVHVKTCFIQCCMRSSKEGKIINE